MTLAFVGIDTAIIVPIVLGYSASPTGYSAARPRRTSGTRTLTPPGLTTM